MFRARFAAASSSSSRHLGVSAPRKTAMEGSNNPFSCFRFNPNFYSRHLCVWVCERNGEARNHSFALFRNMLFKRVAPNASHYGGRNMNKKRVNWTIKESEAEQESLRLRVNRAITLKRKESKNTRNHMNQRNFSSSSEHIKTIFSVLYRCVSGPNFSLAPLSPIVMAHMRIWACTKDVIYYDFYGSTRFSSG